MSSHDTQTCLLAKLLLGTLIVVVAATSHAAERDCTIPAGRDLLLPSVHRVRVTMPEDGVVSIDEVREHLCRIVDSAEVSCGIEGQAVSDLESYRIQSVMFETIVPDDAILGPPPGTCGPNVDDGCYLLLVRRPAGIRTLHFRGTLNVPDVLESETETHDRLLIR